MGKYKFLEPYTFKNGVTVKNRIVIPPMTEQSSLEDGSVSRDETYYASLRSGGVGMFISPVAYVIRNGKGFEGQLSASDDKFIPSLAKMATAMKGNGGGTKAILQIFHAGRMSNSAILRGNQTESASAIAAPREGMETPRELTNDEIEEIIKAFGDATRRAILAGFDGVEIHGANTYLIQQFFSPNSNRRTDKWGGSVEKRMRFGLEIINIVKKTIDELADQPLDYLHISMGNAWRKSLNDKSEDRPTILRIKDQVKGRLPLISVGSIQTPADAEKIMDAGIDFAALGREYLREPRWIEKVENGLEDTIRYSVNRTELDNLGLNPALMDFLGILGLDLGFEGENKKTENGVDAVFKD